jgi:hypothetical protein
MQGKEPKNDIVMDNNCRYEVKKLDTYWAIVTFVSMGQVYIFWIKMLQRVCVQYKHDKYSPCAWITKFIISFSIWVAIQYMSI